MPRAFGRRFGLRRLSRHLTLALLSGAYIAVLLPMLRSDDQTWRLSMTTAYVSFVWLIVCLAIGPVNLMRGRPNPVSTDIRRDVGIWAGVFALVHTVIGAQVHLGHWWLYFVYPSDEPHRIPMRHDLFGFANYTGLGAAFLVLILLALSNDLSLRRLGTRRWKRLQRWNYGVTALLALHALAYQLVERRPAGFVGVIAVGLLTAAGLQLRGLYIVRWAASERERAA